MDKIKLKINHCEDRSSIVSILAFAGYKVSVESFKEQSYSINTDYYVVIESTANAAILTDLVKEVQNV